MTKPEEIVASGQSAMYDFKSLVEAAHRRLPDRRDGGTVTTEHISLFRPDGFTICDVGWAAAHLESYRLIHSQYGRRMRHLRNLLVGIGAVCAFSGVPAVTIGFGVAALVAHGLMRIHERHQP